MRVSAREAEKNLIKRVEPVLPEGTIPEERKIRLSIVIDRDGTVADVSSLDKAQPAGELPITFVHSAMAAARQWKYKVFLKDDSPQVVRTEVIVEFKADLKPEAQEPR